MKTRVIAILSLMAALWCTDCGGVLNDAIDEMTLRQASWYTFLGGAGTNIAHSVQQTADGGYIVVGRSVNFSLPGKTPINSYNAGEDMLVVKLDSNGSVDWFTFLGGATAEAANSVQQTADGGYIVAGYASGNIDSLQGKTPINAYKEIEDMLVVKLDSNGNVDWFTFLGGAGREHAESVQQTADGGYIIAGYGEDIPSLQMIMPINANSGDRDMLVLKLDASGNVSWWTFLGGDYAWSVQQTSDGGYIVAGRAVNDFSLQGKMPINSYNGSEDMLVVKLDSNGSVDWFTFLGGATAETANSVQQTADGGYIIAGYGTDIPSLQGKTPINAYSAGFDMLVVKLDSNGSVDWFTFLGGVTNDTASSVQQTADGGYIVAGGATGNIDPLQGKTPINAYSADFDTLMVKLDSNGSVDWFTFLGGAGADQAGSVHQTADGGYIIAGLARADIPSLHGKTPLIPYSGDYDMLVIKLKNDGTL